MAAEQCLHLRTCEPLCLCASMTLLLVNACMCKPWPFLSLNTCQHCRSEWQRGGNNREG